MTDLATLETIERDGITSMGGNPLTLLGNETKQGDPAPDFTCVDNALKPVSLSDYRGKVVVIASVPSLDTGVCDMETKKFNEKMAEFGSDAVTLVISTDLPFAQKRWCGANGIENVITLSDHRDTSFGLNYGVLIKNLRLEARAVFVVDQDMVVRLAQIVPDLGQEPDYDKIIAEVRDLL